MPRPKIDNETFVKTVMNSTSDTEVAKTLGIQVNTVNVRIAKLNKEFEQAGQTVRLPVFKVVGKRGRPKKTVNNKLAELLDNPLLN